MSRATHGGRKGGARRPRPAPVVGRSGPSVPGLDADIAAAVRAFGAIPRTCRRVTGLPSPRSDRAAFRVGLADGRVVKVRRASRVAAARRYAALVRALPQLPLAPVYLREGRVVVEAWVRGAPLSERPCTHARLAAAAAILRGLHDVRRLHRRGLVARRASTRDFGAGLARRLAALVAAGAVGARDAARIDRALAATRPAHARLGVIHGDLCAENIVEDRAGRLHVVDNAGMRIGFVDYDLARAWYRWSMPDGAWRAFLASYAGGDAFDPAAPAPFWRLAAVVRSAHLRVVRATPAADVPLRRLRALARRLPRG
jgi:aminoglycoside phosphotransferase